MKASDKALQSEAKKMLKGGITAPKFSAHFFGPAGKLASQCATSADRKQMVSSEIYRWLQQQLGVLRAQEAEAFNQETKALSGRVTIVIPKSLHAALKREATSEGVSLSELMRLKLAVKFSQSAKRLTRRRKSIGG